MSGSRAVPLALIVNTYQKPRHLELVLESIAAQVGVAGAFEVIVTDDGSLDDTPEVVSAFAARVDFPVRFTTQPHNGFRLAAIRNAGARRATGEMLLFLDGDCILPCDHLAAFLACRQPGVALLGYCARLPEATSQSLVPGTLGGIDLAALVPAGQRRALAHRRLKAWWYTLLRHPSKPRLAGGNFAVWQSDFRRVNGFDERFRGWGQEDDDLGLRLRASGVRLESILHRTSSLHVWHPSDPSATLRWRDGANVKYFERRGRLTSCRQGLEQRSASAILWGLPADLPATQWGAMLDEALAGVPRAAPEARCEIDIVLRPGTGEFRRRAECRLLLCDAPPEGSAAGRGPADLLRLRRQADRVVMLGATSPPARAAAQLREILAGAG